MNAIVQFFAHAVSSSDKSVDSLILGGVFVALPALILFQAWDILRSHNAFSPINFATGCGIILAAVGGGKGVRDHWGGGDGPAS